MEQTLAIKGRGRVSREEIIKIQEEANRKAMTVRRVRTGALIAANVLVSLFILLPLLYAVSVAFMPPGELFATEMNLVPRQPTLDNFRQALVKIPLVRFVCNSFITAGLITVGQIISCSLAALSFYFLVFKGKNVLFMLVMATMMIPGEATIISNYLTVSQWNWLDSYQVLIVPYLTSAMGIFLFRQFYKSSRQHAWAVLHQHGQRMTLGTRLGCRIVSHECSPLLSARSQWQRRSRARTRRSHAPPGE